jgi:hypothetical protein
MSRLEEQQPEAQVRLSGTVTAELFAIVDAWCKWREEQTPGVRWTRQGAIEFLTRRGLETEADESPDLTRLLEEARK